MNPQRFVLSRRSFLDFTATGLGTAAAATLLKQDSLASTTPSSAPERHPPARAKRAIHICLVGGLSQIDSFDYKPELTRLHGKPLPDGLKPRTFFGKVGLIRQSDWRFAQHGHSGLWISELFPHLARVADELTILRSMKGDTPNHMPAMFQENSGFQANGFPSLGSWLSFGLGNASESLPTFVVLPDARSQPNGGAANWSSGFLPASHQGVLFSNGPEPVRDLFAAERAPMGAEQEALTLLSTLNQTHLAHHEGETLLNARIQAYALAARMQTSIPEAVDFQSESDATQQAYGLHRKETADCAKRCLLARRLLERGVRFVQIYSGGAFGGKPRHGWDGHEDNRENHQREAAMIDQPVAALLTDLRQRGLLDDTLVLFTTEFGRTPFTQSEAGTLGAGRDHNHQGFSVWMAGAGLRRGVAYGETDPTGMEAIQNPVTWPDFHATVLHLLGIDHEKLTFYHNGIQRRLTNVHGHVIKALLA